MNDLKERLNGRTSFLDSDKPGECDFTEYLTFALIDLIDYEDRHIFY